MRSVLRFDKADLSHETFTNEFWIPGRPVIISNAINDWEASTKWFPRLLQERFEKEIVSVRQTQHNDYRIGTTYTTENMTVKITF
jgi:hypothetical protein